MRRILSVVAFSTVFSISALAANWSGMLLDSACYDKQKQADSCAATSTTTAFALDASGKVYKLDAAGNAQAAAAVKNRADRSDPAKGQPAHLMAKVDGTEKDGTITVTTIEVQ
jgi:hypothetical protein